VDGDETGPAHRQPAGRERTAGRRWGRVRRVVPMTRLVVVLALIVVSVVVITVVAVMAGPPSKDDLLRQAGLTGKRELLIGVKDDQPGVALRNPDTGVYTGFDIDIAYLIASDLGFRPVDVRFLSIESEDRERMRAYDPKTNTHVTVDMVIASYSITPARTAAGANFSAPYLLTEQSVVTRKDHRPVEALADLADERVCTIATSTSADALRNAGIKDPKLEIKISSCITGLVDHPPRYDAVTTDAAILAGFVHDPRYRGGLKHYDIGLEADEKWGVNVGPNEALRTLVDLSLYQSWHDPDDRRWEAAYDRNLRPEEPDSEPQDVAVGQQPPVHRPEVRQWPWQR
jgi:ABC-type amino acid transport substrate-binding protein